MAKVVALGDEEYVTIGRRFGSAEVAQEAGEAKARWTRDAAVLADYGFGASALAAFEAQLGEHERLRARRPEAVAAKSISVDARDAALRAGWEWTGKVVSLLSAPARSDAALAAELHAAAPREDSELAAGMGSLKTLLERVASALPADAHVADRIAEADGLAREIRSSAGATATAKAAPVAETRDIDLADGKIYIVIKDLNAAARRAVRAGRLRADAGEYTFHHLLRPSGKPAAKKTTSEQQAP